MRRLALATPVVCAVAASVALACAIAASVALAATSHTNFWQNNTKTAVCGKRIGSGTFHLLCSAKGIPRPSTGSQGGDPFVVLRPTGKPHLVLLSQREFPPGNPKTLPDTTTWKKDRIKCKVSGYQVTCTNASGHGFTIGNGKYRSF